jgi:hypothetical protein
MIKATLLAVALMALAACGPMHSDPDRPTEIRCYEPLYEGGPVRCVEL